MARSLKFGRLPAKAPDLTATIMGMIREYENARDRNIVSAWNEGGEFEGKPVTDERLLDHFDQRIADTDPGDPMYDYWRETKWQYQFNIAEQKVGLAYAQGRMTTGGMARFYKTWAGKVPRHSAVYRDLMTSAAKFGQATRSGSQASGAAAHAKAVANQIENIYQTEVAPVRAARTYLDQFAALHGFNGIGDMNITEAAAFDELLASTAETDPDTYDQMKRAMRDVGLGGGPLTVNDVIRGMDKATAGLRKVIRIKKREGYATTDDENAVAELKKGKKTLQTVSKDIPDQVEAINRELATALAEADGDPIAAIKARQEASADLLALSKKTPEASISGSLYQQHLALLGETATGTTVREDYAQRGGTGGRAVITPEEAQNADLSSQTTEMESLAASARADIDAAKGLADGSLVRVYDEVSKTYDYVDPATLGVVGTKPVVSGGVTLVDSKGKETVIPGGIITHAAKPMKNGVVMVGTDQFGQPVSPELAQTATNVVYSQDFGDGDVAWVVRTQNPDGTISTSYSNESPLQGGSDGKDLPRTLQTVDGEPQWVVQIDPQRVAELNHSSTYIDPKTGMEVYDPTKIDLDPNALLDPTQRDITDVLGVGHAAQGGIAQTGQTYTVDAEGKVVTGQGVAQSREAVDKADPLAWLPDSVSGLTRGQGAGVKADETRQQFLDRLGYQYAGFAPSIGRTDGPKDGMSEKMWLRNKLTEAGVTVPTSFDQEQPKGEPPAPVGGTAPTPPAGGAGQGGAAPVTGVASTYSMLDFLRGANPAATAFAASSGATQPNLTNVMTWSSNVTRAAAKNQQSASKYAQMDRVALFEQAVKENPALATDPAAQQRFFMEFDAIDQNARLGSDRAFQSSLARWKQPVFNSFLGGAIRDAFETPQEKASRLGLTTAQQLAGAGALGGAAKSVFEADQRQKDWQAKRDQIARDNSGAEDGPPATTAPDGGIAGPGLPGTPGVGLPGMLGTGTTPKADPTLGGLITPITGTELQNIFDPHRNDYAPKGSIPTIDVRSAIGQKAQPKPVVVPDVRPDVRSSAGQKKPDIKVPNVKPPNPPPPVGNTAPTPPPRKPPPPVGTSAPVIPAGAVHTQQPNRYGAGMPRTTPTQARAQDYYGPQPAHNGNRSGGAF